MQDLYGYQILARYEKGYEIPFVKAIDIKTRRGVLIRTLNQKFSSRAQLSKLRHEFEILEPLEISGVLKPIALEQHQNQMLLIFEDPGLEPMTDWHVFQQGSIASFLNLAIQAVEILSQIHGAGILHYKLEPGAFLWHPEEKHLVLSNFNQAIRSQNALQEIPQLPPQGIAMPFMAPEQSGRLNRPVDYRTDYYSLGAVFYFWLTGQAPFPSADALRTIHYHIAKKPRPLYELEPKVPRAISGVVLKLLAKMADNRYQSPKGLIHDLEQCRQEWQKAASIKPFTLGRRDIVTTFRLSEKIYGRESESRNLDKALKVTKSGKFFWLAFFGDAGTGKTRLLAEVQNVALQQEARIARGKFQPQTNLPFSALTSAFRELLRQLLAEEHKTLEAIKSDLLQALGGNGKVLIEFLPELEVLIGPQPEVLELEPQETGNRFLLTFRRFIQSMCHRNKPLVLLLDDLHWADQGSIKLLNSLARDKSSAHLLVCTTMAVSDQTKSGPWLLPKDSPGNMIFCQLNLIPLDESALCEWISDSCHMLAEDAKKLAKLTLEKTKGNPFFVKQFWSKLYAQSALVFESECDYWSFDPNKVAAVGITDNVAALMSGKMAIFDEQTKKILGTAACIGNSFDLDLLSKLMQLSVSHLLVSMVDICRQNFLIPVGKTARWLQTQPETETMNEQDGRNLTFKFPHDRIWQGAYGLMNASHKKDMHRQIGRHFLAMIEQGHKDISTIVAVNHLNRGTIEGDPERIDLAELNHRAGLKAVDEGATDLAWAFFSRSVDLYGEEGWSKHYRDTFKSTLLTAEFAGLAGDSEQAELHFFKVLKKSRTKLDKSEVHYRLIRHYNYCSELEASVQVGRESLKNLGWRIPYHDHEVVGVLKTVQQEVEALLHELSTEKVLHAPDCKDKEALARMNLMMHTVPPAFNANRNFFNLLSELLLKTALTEGNSPIAAFAFACYGIRLYDRGQFQRAYNFGQLADALAKKYPDPAIKVKIDLLKGNFLDPWTLPHGQEIDLLRKVYEHSLAMGDFTYANYAGLVLATNLFAMETHLTTVLHECAGFIGFAEQTSSIAGTYSLRFIQDALQSLLDHQASDRADAPNNLNQLKEVSYWTGYMICQTIELILAYLDDDAEKALSLLEESREHLPYVTGTLFEMLYRYFFVLTKARFGDASDPDTQAAINQDLGALKAWAEHCPQNFEAQYLLAQGEVSRATESEAVKPLFQLRKAAKAAFNHRFPMTQAIANLRLADLCLQQGFHDYAMLHLREAALAINNWGAISLAKKALAQAEALERQYGMGNFGMLFDANPLQVGPRFDLHTVIKISQALSSEIVQDQLLERLMNLLMENMGAQRCALFTLLDNHLVLEAEASIEDQQIHIYDQHPLEENENLPKSVIQYVARTKEPLLLEENSNNPTFAADPYLLAARPKSVLCAPLVQMADLKGVLYLENRDTAGAFPSERLELLLVLAPQIGISLDNARMYANMQSLNRNLRKEIEDRVKAEEEVEKLQEVSVANAHEAGRAEFATTVLHNIKNVLNSIRVSCEATRENVRDSKMHQMLRAVKIIEKHLDDPVDFFANHSKGRIIPSYLVEIADILHTEHEDLVTELEGMYNKIALMRDIIETQQSYAKAGTHPEIMELVLLVEEAIRIQMHAIQRNGIQIKRHYRIDPKVRIQKTQLTHILINLIKNAIEAMEGCEADKRHLTLTIEENDDNEVVLHIRDSGIGIDPEHIRRMFTRGFTTKSSGHGFGLHYCAQAMQAMGGRIRVDSPGKGQGAVFSLTFPKLP